jgi:hypothetical protein
VGVAARLGRGRRGAGFGLLLTCALLLGGCARTSYMGIPLGARGAGDELARIAERARDGDRQAQYELGVRFRDGLGVPKDVAAARALFRLAAQPRGGTRVVSNPVTASTSVVYLGPEQQGLEEARQALLALDHADRAGTGAKSPAGTAVLPDALSDIVATMYRIELYTGDCLARGQGGSGAAEDRSEASWTCLVRKPLPQLCSLPRDVHLRMAWFARFLPQFTSIRPLLADTIRSCPPSPASPSPADPRARRTDTILDVEARYVAQNWPGLNRQFSDIVDVKAPPGSPGVPNRAFLDEMCAALSQGRLRDHMSFWLVMCATESGRQPGSASLDEFLAGREGDSRSLAAWPVRASALMDVVETIYRIELFTGSCLARPRGLAADPNWTAEVSWQCFVRKQVPELCSLPREVHHRVAWFARFLPQFAPVRPLVARTIEGCKGATPTYVTGNRPLFRLETIFDVSLGEGDREYPTTVAEREERSRGDSHRSDPEVANGYFANRMCDAVARGQVDEHALFWLLYCADDGGRQPGFSSLTEILQKGISK